MSIRYRKWFLAFALAFQALPWLLLAFDQLGGFRTLVELVQPLVLRHRNQAGALVAAADFIIAYWWTLSLLVALLSTCALAAFALWDSSRPYWWRIGWALSFFLAPFIAAPLFCVIGLARHSGAAAA